MPTLHRNYPARSSVMLFVFVAKRSLR